MDLPAGQVIARVGHNGSGKTTLAKLEVQRPQPALSYCFIRNAAAATARPEDHPGGCQGHVVRHRGARAGIAAAWNVPWRTPAPCERAPGQDETGLIRFHGISAVIAPLDLVDTKRPARSRLIHRTRPRAATNWFPDQPSPYDARRSRKGIEHGESRFDEGDDPGLGRRRRGLARVHLECPPLVQHQLLDLKYHGIDPP